MLPYSNLQLEHRNPGAEKPLILPVHVVCNTSDEQIHENIRINSRRSGDWLSGLPAHDGHAVLCGSGPSIANHLETIRQLKAQGAAVFALNNAAKYLSMHGIQPDYQVIIDARPETAQLVGPANMHLFASQVHPDCFDKVDLYQLWHLQITDMDDLLPDYNKPFCMIGGAASVGNTATCLAYAMGYRRQSLFGYDSSATEGRTHALHQPINDGEPMAWVTFHGKQYLVSLTMKLQAEKFMQTSRDLRQLGCHLEVYGTGLLPDMFNAPRKVMTEAEKYELMWTLDAYRTVSPGEHCVAEFMHHIPPCSVVDLGCGTGRASVELAAHGYTPTLVDFTPNSRDFAARPFPFVQADLTKDSLPKAEAALCTDVMEHLPTDVVRTTLKNIASAAPVAFFQISTVPDNMGAEIGQDLHLTVRPHSWWLNELLRIGKVVWQEERVESSLFVIHTHQRKIP